MKGRLLVAAIWAIGTVSLASSRPRAAPPGGDHPPADEGTPSAADDTPEDDAPTPDGDAPVSDAPTPVGAAPASDELTPADDTPADAPVVGDAAQGGIPASGPPSSDEAPPLLTLPPHPTTPTTILPASDSRRLPAWPGTEPTAPTEADGTEPPLAAGSISCGSANRGALHRPAELAVEGPGFVIPDPWRSRQLRYGTDELIGLVHRTAASVSGQFPGAVLGVADLSDYDGGAIPRHRSHQSGRDVDFLFYARDEAGAPMVPDRHMAWFNRKGRATYARTPVFERNIPLRDFDVAANWALVRALITDRHVEVERIFVSTRIRRWLLRHARETGESDELQLRAARVLHRPRRGDSHNDHMHVRIACSEDDVWHGRCRAGSARGRRRLYTRIRCPRPLRKRAPDIAATPRATDAATLAFPGR